MNYIYIYIYLFIYLCVSSIESAWIQTEKILLKKYFFQIEIKNEALAIKDWIEKKSYIIKLQIQK